MATEFVTLKKTDKEFPTYIGGRLKDGRRSVLFNGFGQLAKDKFTFEVKQESEIQRPQIFLILKDLLRFDTLLLTVLPAVFYAYIVNVGASGHVSIFKTLGFIFAMICFHASVFLKNDYEDYVKGSDSLEESSGHKILQNGWLTAKSVLTWSYVYLALGVVTGVFLLINNPAVIGVSAIAVFLAVFAYSVGAKSFKSVGLGELIAFVCLGPVLTYVASTIFGFNFFEQWLLASVFFGLSGALYVSCRHLENIMADQQSGSQTLSVKLGFEKSKRLIVAIFCLLFLVFSLLLYSLSGFVGLSVSLLLVLPFTVYLFLGVLTLKSPLASQMRGLYRKSLWFQALCVGILAIMVSQG